MLATGKHWIKSSLSPIWDIPYILKEVDENKPLCIMVPGYRSRGIDSEDNMALQTAVNDLGVSTLSFDYSGCDNLGWRPDPATMDTYIRDAKRVIALTGDRPHILLPKSAGVNIALAAADAKTRAMVAVLPIHDFVERTATRILDKKPLYVRLAARLLLTFPGAVVLGSSVNPQKPKIKMTGRFVLSANHNNLTNIFAENTSRFPVVLIGKEGDKSALPDMLGELGAILKEAAYPTDISIVQGEGHRLNPDAIAQCVRFVRHFAKN